MLSKFPQIFIIYTRQHSKNIKKKIRALAYDIANKNGLENYKIKKRK
jgi:hypothetical protein